jgi:hypothetical protein
MNPENVAMRIEKREQKQRVMPIRMNYRPRGRRDEATIFICQRWPVPQLIERH